MKAIFNLMGKDLTLENFKEGESIYAGIISDGENNTKDGKYIDYMINDDKLDYQVYNYYALKGYDEYEKPINNLIVLYNTVYEGMTYVNNEGGEEISLNGSKVVKISHGGGMLTLELENGEAYDCYEDELKIIQGTFGSITLKIIYN